MPRVTLVPGVVFAIRAMALRLSLASMTSRSNLSCAIRVSMPFSRASDGVRGMESPEGGIVIAIAAGEAMVFRDRDGSFLGIGFLYESKGRTMVTAQDHTGPPRRR